MPQSWQDLFVRADIRDATPEARHGGFGSPDILRVGTAPADPQRYATRESYGAYYTAPLRPGVPNYIYVRAKNASPVELATANAFLAMCDPAIVAWPGSKSWTPVKTVAGNLFNPLVPDRVGGNAIGVTKDPFVFVPAEFGSRCLVAWLSTRTHPISSLPTITSVDALAAFVVDNPTYAHQAIDIAPNTTGATTNTLPFSSGSARANWTFGLQVEGGKGFTVSFASTTPLPDGRYVALPPITVPHNDRITFPVVNVDLPAGWETAFTYTYEQHNIIPPAFKVAFAAYCEPPVGSPSYERAASAEDLDFVAGSVQGDYRAIEVGSVSRMFGIIP